MTYQLVLTGKFKKGLKRAKKRGLDIELLDTVVDKLIHGLSLDDKHRDHELKGRYTGFRECHIQPDWLLIYLIEHDILTLSRSWVNTRFPYLPNFVSCSHPSHDRTNRF